MRRLRFDTILPAAAWLHEYEKANWSRLQLTCGHCQNVSYGSFPAKHNSVWFFANDFTRHEKFEVRGLRLRGNLPKIADWKAKRNEANIMLSCLNGWTDSPVRHYKEGEWYFVKKVIQSAYIILPNPKNIFYILLIAFRKHCTHSFRSVTRSFVGYTNYLSDLNETLNLSFLDFESISRPVYLAYNDLLSSDMSKSFYGRFFFNHQ